MSYPDEYIGYLLSVLWWVSMELDNTADAIGPVPELAEEGLRSMSSKLLKVAEGERVDLGLFGPASPSNHPADYTRARGVLGRTAEEPRAEERVRRMRDEL